MIFSPSGKWFRLQMLGWSISLTIGSASLYASDTIQFNTDVLDVNDRENIDLSQFSRGGYIMPGTYDMIVHINKNDIPEQAISFFPPEDDPKGSLVCLSPALVGQFGLKPEAVKALIWWHKGDCLDIDSLKGAEAQPDLATSSLYLNIPQTYLEYTATDWDPPSRWDEGIPGLLLDYNVNAQGQRQQRDGNQVYSASANGTTGVNMGAWRLRADWQGNLDKQSGSRQGTTRKLDWSRYYAYRALPALRSRLTLGENYLDSGLFDSFRFAGLSLVSDDNMLPPNLRGYAPEVVGLAKTNAKVIISQRGRTLYETQVASGPFRIQDINDAISGELSVRVEEQDGSVQEFTMNTSNIPYLTRPGSVRFKFASGKPSDWEHRMDGPMFGTGEFSWGVSNGWSLYGGALAGNDYNALSLGIGRDLMVFGALSFDATQSRASLPEQSATLSGGSYRISYSKTFEKIDSQVTFAGYRFSEEDFMNMGQYLDALQYGVRSGGSKEMYTLTFNKHFRDLGLSTYLNYSHQTYWNRPENNRYNLTMSRYFDIGRFRNLSLSLSAYRNRYRETNDDGMYLSLVMPWGNHGNLSYNTTAIGNDLTHRIGYYNRPDENNSYQLSTGTSRNGASLSGYYNREGDMARMSANASFQEGQYSAVGLSAQGGATLTAEGGALHRGGMMGGTRMLLDTEGVPGVPVRGYGATTDSNTWGKVVVADVSSYYKNKASIDLDKLGDDAEAIKSVVQATLTEGAIGYRKFSVIAGQKAMATIRLPDGSSPPFGASVINVRGQNTGIINDGGSVYLSGINAGDRMVVQWNGTTQCEVNLPTILPEDIMSSLLLPCNATGAADHISDEEKTDKPAAVARAKDFQRPGQPWQPPIND